MGIYVQDSLDLRRATFTGGLRLDMQRESTDEVTWPVDLGSESEPHVPSGQGIPDWKDIDPRFGVSYDLFGTGRTALKASVSREGHQKRPIPCGCQRRRAVQQHQQCRQRHPDHPNLERREQQLRAGL
jgi:hypothetical protein